jgi:aspartate carbamoyltransferase catalytic subunit
MFIINNEVLSRAKPTTIVMHPLPRVNEIDPEVDFDSRAAYFRQMRQGESASPPFIRFLPCSPFSTQSTQLLLTFHRLFSSGLFVRMALLTMVLGA